MKTKTAALLAMAEMFGVDVPPLRPHGVLFEPVKEPQSEASKQYYIGKAIAKRERRANRVCKEYTEEKGDV